MYILKFRGLLWRSEGVTIRCHSLRTSVDIQRGSWGELGSRCGFAVTGIRPTIIIGISVRSLDA